ncbi:MAG TPA: hypothetical protein P5105_02850 [Victivallales bacterium]|nr:hypothetical protein [Victivallales bacterium]HRR06198.1 hypothetical protein [Victivallales bacterium]HRR28336.1 hypothetical protein [Victivallales bacterium]
MTDETIRRKRDIVSVVALLLFGGAIFFELYIIFLIPYELRKENRWKKGVIIEELLELQDELRSNITGAITKYKNISGELELAKACLDDYARYLRENKDKITIEQAETILSKIIEFKRIYEKTWKRNGGSLEQKRELDTSKFIKFEEKKLK